MVLEPWVVRKSNKSSKATILEYLLGTSPVYTIQILCLHLHTNPRSRCYCFSHFTDEDPETQKCEAN